MKAEVDTSSPNSYARHMIDQRTRAVDRRRPLVKEIPDKVKRDGYATLTAAIKQAQEQGHA